MASLPLPPSIVLTTTLSRRPFETDETSITSDPDPPSTCIDIRTGESKEKNVASTVILSSPDPPSTQTFASKRGTGTASVRSRKTSTRSWPAPPKSAVLLKRLDRVSRPARPKRDWPSAVAARVSLPGVPKTGTRAGRFGVVCADMIASEKMIEGLRRSKNGSREFIHDDSPCHELHQWVVRSGPQAAGARAGTAGRPGSIATRCQPEAGNEKGGAMAPPSLRFLASRLRRARGSSPIHGRRGRPRCRR